ncbi:hypothetical protein BN2475_830014 [Paraburkholderia ribeironis]|uniref:Uncharacterized protein n=1 Tax=Paraburkholderia ribeironis TaxID=1247936 RepID=A0A1N7SLK8_9BURK|nr:hypothetical protein BN2475_830014 [Paraburkholderia ribeironis]
MTVRPLGSRAAGSLASASRVDRADLRCESMPDAMLADPQVFALRYDTGVSLQHRPRRFARREINA